MQTTLESDTVLAPEDLANIPCDGRDHKRGISGHVVEDPGAFIVVSPCCGPSLIQCAGRVNYWRTYGLIMCSRCETQHLFEAFTFIPVGSD
jgi:hypothetical protein